MNNNKVAAALAERQNIVVQGPVWTERMKMPPLLHQSAAPATSRTPRRWRAISVMASAERAKGWKGRMKHAA